MSNTVELSLVIPCFNESKNVEIIKQKALELIATNPYLEVLLVDNGSSDDSLAEFTRIQEENNPQLCVVRVDNNIGYGNGILQGLYKANGKFLAWTHADLQTDPNDVIVAYKLAQSCNDMQKAFIKGARQDRPLLDTFFTFGMQCYSSFKLGVWLSDINAQPKLFSKTFFQSLNQPPLDFSLDLFVYFEAKQQGLEIRTIPVRFDKRKYGEAKGGGSWKTKIKLIKRTFKYINELAVNLKEGRQ